MTRAESDAEEEDLLREVRTGDREAFDRLFKRYRAFLRQAIDMRLDAKLRSRLDASDVVQETQLEAFRRLPDYLARQPMPFRLWLRKMAQERLLNARRRHVQAKCRTVDREVPLPERSSLQLARQMLAGGPTPSQQFARGELTRRVRHAIAGLPAIDREVLLMRVFEGLSDQEVGHVLDVEPATVNKRHGRALLRLSKALVETGLGESPP